MPLPKTSSPSPASSPPHLLINEGPQNLQHKTSHPSSTTWWRFGCACWCCWRTPDPSPWKNLGDGEGVPAWQRTRRPLFLINRTVPQPAQGIEQLARESRKKPWLTESSSSAVQVVSLSGFHRSLGTRTIFWVLVLFVWGFFNNKQGNRSSG